MRSATLVLLLVGAPAADAPAAAAASPPRGPLVPKDPNAQPCTHPTIKIGGSVKLKQGCIYNHHFVINASNTTLDCQGAQIAPADPAKYAIGTSGSIDNVLVRNCYTTGGKGVGVMPPKRLEGESNEDYRKRSPTGVVFTNLHVTKSSNVGVYIHHHVVGATVKDSIIEGNNRPGMYLGAESQGNRVHNNLIRGNGFLSEEGLPEIGWARREGIAVDASAYNVIEDNQIEGNAFGGVFLYKNCWEHAARNPDSKPRIQHSHSNVIRGNSFSDMEFGVWVAARQARNLMFMECGDPTPYNNPIWIQAVFHPGYPVFKGTYPAFYLPLVSIWPDYAEKNAIEGNTFRSISKAGIRIEDDRTSVSTNLFIGDFEYIYLGSPFRANLIGKPVDGTIIGNNSFASPKSNGFAGQLALVPGEHTNTQLQNNLRACLLPSKEWIRNGAEVLLDKGAGPRRFTCSDGALVCTDPTCAPDAGLTPDSGGADLVGVDAAGVDLHPRGDAPPAPAPSSGGCALDSTGGSPRSALALLALVLGLGLGLRPLTRRGRS
jgi:parallel beta-helix repeat protein